MRTALSLTTLLVLTVTVQAAPLPEAPPLTDKYLLDDADFVLVANVKQILASPVYKKSYDKLVGDFLKDEKVAALLKDLGVDPLKDVDRVCVVMGRSCFPGGKAEAGSGPMFLVQGRFDSAKLQAGAKKLAKTTHDHGDAKIYEYPMPGMAMLGAVLDKGTVVVGFQKELVEAALDKAAGKKKTTLKHKTLAAMFGKIKPEQALAVIATGDMVLGASGTKKLNPDGTVEYTSTVHTLSEAGIEALNVVVDVKDEIKGKATLTAKNADKAREIEKHLTEGLKRAIGEAEKEKGFENVVKAMKSLKISAKDDTITLEGQGNGEAVKELFAGFFYAKPSTRPADPKPDSIKRDK